MIALNYSVEDEVVHLSVDRSSVTATAQHGEIDRDFEATPAPRKVIATTITPFDKFPFRINPKQHRFIPAHDANSIYQYLGAKNQAGQVSSRGYLSRVIDSLIGASGKSRDERARLHRVFEFLGYESHIAVHFEIRASARQLDRIRANETAAAEEWLNSQSYSRNRYPEDVRDRELAWDELVNAAEIVAGHAENRSLNIDLDFVSGIFRSGSLEVYRAAQIVRAAGLLTLVDLRLTRNDAQSETISIRDASSGEQAIALTLLGVGSAIEDDSLVIIDEPEISLHPEWQQKFVSLLAATFAEYSGCHFLLATHSPLIVAQGSELLCAVVTMDDFEIHDAAEFRKRSADFQLAEVFETPGYRNEYLAREALAAMRLAGRRETDNDEFRRLLVLLTRTRPHMQDDDPVAELADAVIAAAGAVTE
jgi:predicted ATPase